MHNIGTIFAFELRRSFRRPSFWIASFLVPVLAAGVLLLMYISNTAAPSSDNAAAASEISFAYTDESGMVDAGVAESLGGRLARDDEVDAVPDAGSDVEAYIVIPADPLTDPVVVRAQDRGLFGNAQYTQLASTLLVMSATAAFDDPSTVSIARGAFAVDTVTYENGVVVGGVNEFIPPLLLLVLFYFLVFMLANHMLNATVEEKENRVAEMILTCVTTSTLLVGKVAGLVVIGLVQVTVLVSPIIAVYILFREQLRLPEFDLSQLVFDPATLGVGALLVLGGFGIFLTTMLAAGAIMPSTKDSGPVFGTMMSLLFIPFYAIVLIATDPASPLVLIFMFFPYTSAVTALLANAFGTLDPMVAAIVIVEQFAMTAILFAIAVKAFRSGAIRYSRVAFRRRPKSATRTTTTTATAVTTQTADGPTSSENPNDTSPIMAASATRAKRSDQTP